MEKRNISYRYISTRSGLSMSTVWRVANFEKMPTQLTMMKIARALNMKTEDVFNLNWKNDALF